jgi:glycine cleavage system H protein
MSNVPSELKYTDSHEWIRKESDGTLTVGITEHAQQLLGDVVFVDVVQSKSKKKSAEDEVGIVESVKAVSDVYSPVSGEIIDVNDDLESEPELINTDPYTEGWLFKIKPDNLADFDKLLDAAAYSKLLEES